MEFEKVCNLIIVAIAIIYTAVMFYSLINLETQHLAKQQTRQQHVSKASIESEQAIITELMLIENKSEWTKQPYQPQHSDVTPDLESENNSKN